jgi:hypothetical protein
MAESQHFTTIFCDFSKSNWLYVPELSFLSENKMVELSVLLDKAKNFTGKSLWLKWYSFLTIRP